ncbi:hypothetical protein EBESD8_45870 [Rhodococcus aetherivorans]|nr:hypothetical protein EBESD8_45870 [Rhodococcus aetherivorans]
MWACSLYSLDRPTIPRRPASLRAVHSGSFGWKGRGTQRSPPSATTTPAS